MLSAFVNLQESGEFNGIEFDAVYPLIISLFEPPFRHLSIKFTSFAFRKDDYFEEFFLEG